MIRKHYKLCEKRTKSRGYQIVLINAEHLKNALDQGVKVNLIFFVLGYSNDFKKYKLDLSNCFHYVIMYSEI